MIQLGLLHKSQEDDCNNSGGPKPRGLKYRPAQSSKRNRRTVGYLAGWAVPNGGPLDAMDSAQAAAAMRYIYTLRGLLRFLLCSAHRWEPTSSLSSGRI